MTPLTGLHVNWTSPHRHGLNREQGHDHGTRPYRLPAEEIVTLVHGALAWKALHGPIEMVTDGLGAAYLKEQGLDVLYDAVDTSLDALDDIDLDPIVYSTGAKIYAASLRPAPFALIDTDLYLRAPLTGLDRGGFVFAHWETTDNSIYPPVGRVPNLAGADLDRWTFDTPAANMAISAFLDEAHRRAYTEAGLGYAIGNAGPHDGHPALRAAFAEQRIAPAVARTLGTDLRPVTERFWIVEDEAWEGPTSAGLFHHTWHQKRVLRMFPELRPAFLRHLLEDLLWRHPDSADLLATVPALGEHTELIRLTLMDVRAHGPATQV